MVQYVDNRLAPRALTGVEASSMRCKIGGASNGVRFEKRI